MVAFTVPWAPNTVKTDVAPGGTSWVIVASDGSTFASLAAMTSAGKKPWPNLDPGMFVNSLKLRSQATGNLSDGSFFRFAINPATAPSTVNDGSPVSSTGQTLIEPAGYVNQVWLLASVSTDHFSLEGRY